MPTLNGSQRSNLNRLPTELILKICGHLSTYDLWHNIRPTSRLLATCAQELLPRKFFQENSINIYWCCFWCSLGPYCLHTICNPITRLFPDAKGVRVVMVNDRVLMTKLIFGNICNLVTSREPKIRIRLGEEGRDITFGSGEILPQVRKHTGDSIQDLQLCQHKFLVWYFAKRRQEVARGRIIGSLGFAAHILRFLAISIVLLIIGLTLALFYCTTVQLFKLLTDSYKGLRNLMRWCLRKGLLLH